MGLLFDTYNKIVKCENCGRTISKKTKLVPKGQGSEETEYKICIYCVLRKAKRRMIFGSDD